MKRGLWAFLAGAVCGGVGAWVGQRLSADFATVGAGAGAAVGAVSGAFAPSVAGWITARAQANDRAASTGELGPPREALAGDPSSAPQREHVPDSQVPISSPYVEESAGHAFISYVREDSERVDELQRNLEAAEIPVWRDTADLWPGQDWRKMIRRAITGNALVFIACFSSQSVARPKSYQNEELLLAVEQLRQRQPDDPWLVPVRFDDCQMPDLDLGGGRTLDSIQRVDLFGDRYEEQLNRLVAAIQRLLGQRPSGPGTRSADQDTGPETVDPAPQPTPQAKDAERTPRGSSPEEIDWGKVDAAITVLTRPGTSAFTAQWRPARGSGGAAAVRSTERIFDHVAYRSGAAEPPAFLFSAIVPCESLGDSQPGPDGMRGQFGEFLAHSAFMDLIADAGEIGPGCGWRPMAGRGRIMLEAHLCASTRDRDQFPVASVKLILPDQDVPAYGSDQDRADLLVRINLPPLKVGLPQWRERFARALALPGHLVTFLTDELSIATGPGRPAEACLRIAARQDSPSGLAEVVDVSMFEALSAPYVPNEFRECQIADPNGSEITTAARKLAQNLAEALHVTGYEQALDGSPT